MYTYTFITKEGFLISIDADSYAEACELYHEMTSED